MTSFRPGYIIKISDSTHADVTGVIVNVSNNNLICFNIDPNNNPIFFQIDLDKTNYSYDGKNNIRQEEYTHLKKELLKYYNLHKVNEKEVKILSKVMEFAYPNGIPTIEDKSNHVQEVEKDDSQFLEVGRQIKVTTAPASSISFLNNQVLDVVDLLPNGIRTLRRGTTSDSNKYYTLFFRNPPHDNSLSGVKEVSILPQKSQLSMTIQDQLKNQRAKNDGFITQIMDQSGNIYELNSTTLELKSMDNKSRGKYFPGTDEINLLSSITSPRDLENDSDSCAESDNESVQSVLIDDDDSVVDSIFSKTLRTMPEIPMTLPIAQKPTIIGGFHIEDNLSDIEDLNLESLGLDQDEDQDISEIDLSQIGGAKSNPKKNMESKTTSSASSASSGISESLEFDTQIDLSSLDDVEKDEIEELKNRYVSTYKPKEDKTEKGKHIANQGSSDLETGSETDSSYQDFDINEFDIEEEPIELSKVVYRSKKVPVPDEKRVYEPQIQKSEFFKYLLEKYIPNKQLRKNNFLVNQVHKINNRIADLKDEFINLKNKNKNNKSNLNAKTSSDDNLSDNEVEENDRNLDEEKLIYNHGNKPLLDSYLKNDYRNKFLIPVVLDRKKLYFPNQVSDYHYEYYTSNSNILNKSHQQVISDLSDLIKQKDSNKISSITYFQLEKAINEMLKPYKINDDSKMIGVIGNNADKIPLDELPFNDYTGLVVRFNKSPFKNQGVDFQESEIEGYNLKTPLVYYVEKFKEKSDEELDLEEDELIMIEDVEKEWIHEESMETTFANKPNLKKIQDGDRFNLIGYLALPLKHALNKHQIYYDTLSGLYDHYQSTTGIKEKIINIDEDSSINQDENVQNENILDDRDKPTFYYFPESKDGENNVQYNHKEYLDKLIPDFKEICRKHLPELKESSNWSQLEKIIENYGYNLRYLNIEDWEQLSHILYEYIEKNTYQLSKRWLDYQKYLQHDSPEEKPSSRYFPLIDKAMIENLENYYDKYPTLNKPIDSDTSRLAWAVQNEDHGKLLELLLSRQQILEDDKNSNKGELEKSIVNIKQELEILEGRYKNELKMSSYHSEKTANECRDKPKYQVGKVYQSIRDLEKDNYIIAKTTVGNMDIKAGQYAVAKDVGKVFIRKELPNKTHVWELTKLKIEQLEELVKQDCETPAFDNLKSIVNGDACQVQKDDMKCYPGHIDRVYRDIKHYRKLLAILEAELEDVNKMEFKKNKLEKSISNTKALLDTKRNLQRLERENNIASYRRIIEDVKKAKNKIKDCPHFQVLNYFMRMKHITPIEKYSLSNMILQKFQDVTPSFLKDLLSSHDNENNVSYLSNMDEIIREYGKFDVINPNKDFNWTYCSLCHQKLICNHVLYAYNIIKETGKLDEILLKDLYGVETDQNYNCKVCGEFLVASDELDLDGFVKKGGQNDTVMITREIIDQENERQVIRKNILDELLDEAESKMDEDSKDMKLFLTTLQTLKSLTKITLLSFDEEDIISFIKSQPFLSREDFKEYLKKTAGAQIQNQQLLDYQADQFFYRFAVYDITSRYLITLQTSEMKYSLSSDICKGNLGGFPLGTLDDLSTARYFVCLLQKLGGTPEFFFLSKDQSIETRFLGRLRLMAQNQNIQIKYNQAIERKSKEVSYEDPFASHPTNFWTSFRPCLGTLDASWTAQNIIDPDKVNKIVVGKYDKFMTDLRMNLSYFSDKLFDNMYNIMSKEEPIISYPKVVKLANSCCLTQLKENSPSSYFDFLYQKEPQLKGLIKNIKDLDYLKYKIEKRTGHIAIPPSYMKVDNVFRFDPYYYVNQPFVMTKDYMNKLFDIYVDSGINIGVPRSFNAFGVCTLSGKSKSEIFNEEHSEQDYKDLVVTIQKKGKIISVKPVDLNFETILANNIDNFLKKNTKIKSTDFIHEFLTNLKETVTTTDEDFAKAQQMKYKSGKQFAKQIGKQLSKQNEIEKQWSLLDQQLDKQIDILVGYLSTIRKDSDLKHKLFKMGDYTKIYQEDDIVDIKSNDPNLFKEGVKKRYARMEKNIKHYLFNFFRSSLSIIKNNAFDKYHSFDMNPQWKYLIYYRDYQPLFKRVFELFNGLTQDLELFNGSNNPFFTYQNSISMLKYIMIFVLNKMIEIEPEKNKKRDLKFTSKSDLDDIDLTIDLKEQTEFDSRIINLKTFSDQKAIILYISQIIDRIIKEEDDFSQLTQSYMTGVATRKLEERNRKNLNIIAILAQDGRKDLRRVIMDQKRLGLIDYEDFADILADEIAAGEDKPAFDRDMELIDELNNMEDVDGHVIEEKIRQKLLDQEIEDDEYSYVQGEDDDIDEF